MSFCGLGAVISDVIRSVLVLGRRVVTTVGQFLCSREKMSKGAAKEFADAVPLRSTASDYQSGLGPGALQSRLLVRRASDKPSRSTAFLRLRPRMSHPHHVLTLCSALVDRAAQNGICGPIFSLCISDNQREAGVCNKQPASSQGSYPSSPLARAAAQTITSTDNVK